MDQARRLDAVGEQRTALPVSGAAASGLMFNVLWSNHISR